MDERKNTEAYKLGQHTANIGITIYQNVNYHCHGKCPYKSFTQKWRDYYYGANVERDRLEEEMTKEEYAALKWQKDEGQMTFDDYEQQIEDEKFQLKVDREHIRKYLKEKT